MKLIKQRNELFSFKRVLDQTLSSDQILSLIETPVEVIPAPGSGYVAIPFLIFMRLYAGSVSYTTISAPLGLTVNGINIFPEINMDGSFMGGTSDQFVYYLFSNSCTPGLDVASCENQPIYLQNVGLSNFADGNGTLDIQIQWDIFNV